MTQTHVEPDRKYFCSIAGTFFRATDPRYAEAALLGSIKAGRYSRPEQRTLYLSASVAGTSAAMIAHQKDDASPKLVLHFNIDAENIFDMREAEAIQHVRKNAGDPFADWQEDIAKGREPSSWRVRDWIGALGANGLIDPSRKAPGLWHLVLFRWNVPGAPSVR